MVTRGTPFSSTYFGGPFGVCCFVHPCDSAHSSISLAFGVPAALEGVGHRRRRRRRLGGGLRLVVGGNGVDDQAPQGQRPGRRRGGAPGRPAAPRVRLDPEALLAAGVAADPAAYGARLTADAVRRPAPARGAGAGAGRWPRGRGPRCGCACAWTPATPPCTPWPGRRSATRTPRRTRRAAVPVHQRGRCRSRATWTAPTWRRSSAAPGRRCGPWSPSPTRPTWPPTAWRPWTRRPSWRGCGGRWAGCATTVLGRETGGPPATLANLAAALREGPDVLCLVCHGTAPARRQRPGGALPVAGAGGRGQPSGSPGRPGRQALRDLPRRPALVVLAVCQSAGRPHEAGALAAVGPRARRRPGWAPWWRCRAT